MFYILQPKVKVLIANVFFILWTSSILTAGENVFLAALEIRTAFAE